MLARTLGDRLALATGALRGARDPIEEEGHWPRMDGVGDEDKPAAVLVAFVDRPQPTLLLTRRQPHLRSHAGQVAFPGGRADHGDADSIATALREAHEEVGLDPAHVTIVGTTTPYRTGTGYLITPVLAIIPPDLPLVPEPGEVARLFEARCDHLFDSSSYQRHSVDWQGGIRHYWETMVDGERVWGVTAVMIRSIGVLLGLDAVPHALNRDWAA